MLARVSTFAIDGLDPRPVFVEVDLRSGLPAFTIVGLADAAVREARERVRAALLNSGFQFPLRRITANLAPAHLPKVGPGFDLALAAALLAASGQVPVDALAGWAIFGELSLGGELRGGRGALAVAEGTRRAGLHGLILPADAAAEAALVEGIEVVGVRTVTELADLLAGRGRPSEASPRAHPPPGGGQHADDPDLRDVRGHKAAISALEIAAAGAHNLLLEGPPGTGKTMLARRIPSILPPLTRAEAVEVTRIHSVAGRHHGGGLIEQRPFRAPHHTISSAGLVGGGSVPAPGEASLAHHGVLFLDELSEFHRPSLEALRQPLEDGRVAIVRGQRTSVFPTAFMLVASTNPCPCGYAGEGDRCRCTEVELAQHRRRLSGPLLDRIDLVVSMGRPSADELTGRPVTSSAAARDRVVIARGRQQARLGSERATANGHMGPALVRRHISLGPAAQRLLYQAYDGSHLSARGHHRVLRVARTVADLANSDRVRTEDLRMALTLRDPGLARQVAA